MIEKSLFREINKSVSGQEVVKMLGIECRNGFIHCPEHLDKHPSCKVYDDGYYCHTCQAHGDNVQLVALVKGISHTEALGLLNSYFNLGFDIEKRGRKKQCKVLEPNPRKILQEWHKTAISNLSLWCQRFVQIAVSGDESEFTTKCRIAFWDLDEVLNDIQCLTPEETKKLYGGIISFYDELSRKCNDIYRAGEHDTTECIRIALGKA